MAEFIQGVYRSLVLGGMMINLESLTVRDIKELVSSRDRLLPEEIDLLKRDSRVSVRRLAARSERM